MILTSLEFLDTQYTAASFQPSKDVHWTVKDYFLHCNKMEKIEEI